MNDPVVLWCLVSALAWVAIGWMFARVTRDPLHIGVNFALLFALSYPIKLMATQYGFAFLNSREVGAVWQLRALALANLSGLAFVLPLFVLARAVTSGEAFPRDLATSARSRHFWLAAFILTITIGLGPANFLKIFSFAQLSALSEARPDERVGSSGGALLSIAALVCLIQYFRERIGDFGQQRLVVRVFSVFGWALASWALLAVSGSKFYALLPLGVAVIVLNSLRVRQGRPWSFNRTIVWSLAGALLLAAAGYLRGFGRFAAGASVGMLTLLQFVAAFDAPDNLTMILSRMHHPWTGDLEFQPTIQYLVTSQIPRFLWPTKPLVMANQFIMERFLPERYTGYTGEVVSPSMPGEMILSGGLFFVIFWSLILGVLFAVVYRKAHSRHPSAMATVAYVWLSLNVFNLLRSGTGILSQLALTLIIGWVLTQLRSQVLSVAWSPRARADRRDTTAARSPAR